MSVAEWVRHHIDHLTGLDDYTVHKYNAFLDNDIAPILGRIPLTELAEEDIAPQITSWPQQPHPSIAPGRSHTHAHARGKILSNPGSLRPCPCRQKGPNSPDLTYAERPGGRCQACGYN